MSDTPRTDYELGVMGGAAIKAVNKVDANFARGLERKLAEARRCLREAMVQPYLPSDSSDMWKQWKAALREQGGEVANGRSR